MRRSAALVALLALSGLATGRPTAHALSRSSQVVVAASTVLYVQPSPLPLTVSGTKFHNLGTSPGFGALNAGLVPFYVQIVHMGDVQPMPVSRSVRRPALTPVSTPAPARPRTLVSNHDTRTLVVGNVWDRIAWCESRWHWADNTGNGYYGGLQMDMNFWRSYGDPRYARPDLAPRSAQIIAATKARDGGRGYEPWPVCGRGM